MRRLRLIFSALLVAVLAVPALAQDHELSWGLRGSLAYSKLSLENETAFLSYGAGLSTVYRPGLGHWAITPQLGWANYNSTNTVPVAMQLGSQTYSVDERATNSFN